MVLHHCELSGNATHSILYFLFPHVGKGANVPADTLRKEGFAGASLLLATISFLSFIKRAQDGL